MAQFEANLSLLYKNRVYSDANVGLQALAQNFQQAAQRIKPILANELLRHLQLTAQMIAARNNSPWPGGTSATTLSRRSGQAMDSLKKGVRVTMGSVGPVGEMYGVFYLFVHEYGATIRAKRAQYLTIPLPAALKPDGTPKYTNARQWNNTFVGRSKKGNLIIFQRQGRRIIPLYVLKKEVKIRARLGLQKAQGDAMDTFIWRVARMVSDEVMK